MHFQDVPPIEDASGARAALVLARIIGDGAQLFRVLAEHTNDVVVLGRTDTCRLYVSPASRAVLGFAPEELIGTRTIDFVHPDDAQIFAEHRVKIVGIGGGRSIARWRHRHKAGHYVRLESSAQPIHDPETGTVVGSVVTMRDDGERWLAEERIRHMALHDGLTGLPNRILFHHRLDQAITNAGRTGRPFVLLACDLDRFKAVNDSLGHQAGDILLRAVSARLQAEMAPSDTLARLGGDEFAVVLASATRLGPAKRVAERLIAAVSEPVPIHRDHACIGMSVGLVVASDQDGGADALLKRADVALYEAKSAGRSLCRPYRAASTERMVC